MAELSTTIDGYRVELDTDMNGDGQTTGCWISFKAFSASLEALMGVGVLISTTDQEHAVPHATIDRIEKWANENGY